MTNERVQIKEGVCQLTHTYLLLWDCWEKKKDIPALRKNAGLVFDQEEIKRKWPNWESGQGPLFAHSVVNIDEGSMYVSRVRNRAPRSFLIFEGLFI